MSFRDRLDAAVDARGPLCVGIDPHAGLLAAWGLPATVDGLARFADACVAAFGPLAAVVKPQSAFFEVFGSAGIGVLERTVAALRQAGALVLLDVKRGDIGSTMAAYAAAYLEPGAPLAVDAITVSPYPGVGALAPVVDLVGKYDVGAFVLAYTSNPEGPGVQQAVTASGRPVGAAVLAEVDAANAALGHASLGAVVGATLPGGPPAGVAEFTGPFLVPGIGAQGGTADDVRRVFGASQRAVLPATSREVLRFGPDPAALRDATARAVESFAFLRA